jgi:hypothetical protein
MWQTRCVSCVYVCECVCVLLAASLDSERAAVEHCVVVLLFRGLRHWLRMFLHALYLCVPMDSRLLHYVVVYFIQTKSA